MESDYIEMCPRALMESTGSALDSPVLSKNETYALLLFGFCGFSVVLAVLYNVIQKYVFVNANNLDATFDAGGKVTLSLTAVTVATQLLWPADLLQSATVTAKNGLAGPFWYAVGVVTNIILFPILSLHFKSRAPGAKTYLQVMKARYGRNAHRLYCCFALITNLVIISCLVLSARATIQSVSSGTSDEMIVLILALMCGSYAILGGLGTKFYVSYFNACLIFIMLLVFIWRIFYEDNHVGPELGNMHKLFTTLNCTLGPTGNLQRSFLTFRSEGSLMFGVVGVFLASSVTFCDQASWQSRVAAEPSQGVWGFILSAYIYYAIPSSLATTTGLAYLALSSQNATHLLKPEEINAGFVTPYVATHLFGPAGGIMVLSMVCMALMSTGSGEVMAVASILVYDIYQTYLRPFRKDLPNGNCILCGKKKLHVSITKQDHEDDIPSIKEYHENSTDYCNCTSSSTCAMCSSDKEHVNARGGDSGYISIKATHTCPIHGLYRSYQDELVRCKDWCIVGVTLAVIPYGLIIIRSGIDLNWSFTTGAIATIPFCPAVFLSISWVKTTGMGIIVGGLSGLGSGILVTVCLASTYDGGLGNFIENTGRETSVLAGCCASFFVSLVVTIVVSLLTHKIRSTEDEDVEWEKTLSINNPLDPWQDKYREEMANDGCAERIITYWELRKTFRRASYLAYIGGFITLALLLLAVPGIMASQNVLDEAQFGHWIRFCHVWTLLMAIFVIFVPPIQEIQKIWRQYNKNKR